MEDDEQLDDPLHLQCDSLIPITKQLVLAYVRNGYTNADLLYKFSRSHYQCTNLTLDKLKKFRSFHEIRSVIDYSDESVRSDIHHILQGPYRHAGYKVIHQVLITDYGRFGLQRKRVARLLRLMDPGGVRRRTYIRVGRQPVFSRRLMILLGVNEMWCIDGFDKLAVWGFHIHACKEAFSRKILWLRCVRNNRDQATVARLYLDAVIRLGRIPRILQTDMGTENGIAAELQMLLCGEDSHRYVRSVYNQRIEATWGYARKASLGAIMDHFDKLETERWLVRSDPRHIRVLHMVYRQFIQRSLDSYITMQNRKRLAQPKNRCVPGGRPDIIFENPGRYGGIQCGVRFPFQKPGLQQYLYSWTKPFEQYTSIDYDQLDLNPESGLPELDALKEIFISLVSDQSQAQHAGRERVVNEPVQEDSDHESVAPEPIHLAFV